MFTESEKQHLLSALNDRIVWTNDRLLQFPASYLKQDDKARYKAFKQAAKELQALQFKIANLNI